MVFLCLAPKLQDFEHGPIKEHFMPINKPVAVKSLHLDLDNYRTISQKDEIKAVQAMIAIKPEWFWALAKSILEGGYYPTENIIVLKGGSSGRKMIVKEGNRRIGALKIIFGYIGHIDDLKMPSEIKSTIGGLTRDWKEANKSVPCAIFSHNEAETVDRIVARTHGKGDRAGRDMWNTIAKARHNRDKNGVSEPALDLLEKYLTKGKNLTPEQRERWSGEYPLTVLDDAMKRIVSRFALAAFRELADQYPRVKYKLELENIIRDVGLKSLDFKKVRDKDIDFAEAFYGIPAPAPKTKPSTPEETTSVASKKGTGTTSGTASKTKTTTAKATAIKNPQTVKNALKKFTPRGEKREKIVTLVEEAWKLNLNNHPHAFCFLLRCIFELSAGAYCQDHKQNGGPSMKKKGGGDKFLVDALRDIVKHLTCNSTDKLKQKELKGAMTELATQDGILSVHSMNQLIHNSNFTIDSAHICPVFFNVFPLLREMNK
jgi:hypothetical protein